MLNGQNATSNRLRIDLANNAISIFARLLAGVLLFIYMAKQMGPSNFGQFMFAMSTGSLIAFLTSLGFNQQVLRDVAAHPETAQTLIRAITSAKISLIACTLIPLTIGSIALNANFQVIALLTLVAIFDSIVEYLFCLLRAKGRYKLEAGFMTVMSLIHFGIMFIVLTKTNQLIFIALFFALSKFIQFLAIIFLYKLQDERFLVGASIAEQLHQIRSGLAYTWDAGIGLLNSQFDTILITTILGTHAAGVYQSGMRLVIGFQNFTVVAGNVFIPKLSSEHRNLGKFVEVAHKAKQVFICLAVTAGLGVWLGGLILVSYGYGREYAELSNLLPWMGLLVALRFIAAYFGIQLTALGLQRYRAKINMLLLLCLIISMSIFSLYFALLGTIISMIAVTSLTLIIFALKLSARSGST